MAIKIVVDSAADIAWSEAESLGISMVPMTIQFGNDTYYDGVDLSPRIFYEKLIESDTLPTTGQVTAFRFSEVFEQLVSEGNEVLAITISSKLSGTCFSALQAAKPFGDRIAVVDSLNACIGERLLCQYALGCLPNAASAKELAAELEHVKGRIRVMAMLGTLEYLKKGGRISATACFAGELLALKPVLALEEGAVKLLGKARGSKNGSNLLCSLVESSGGIDFDMPYGVIWSGLDDTLLQKYVQDSAHLWQEHVDHIPSYLLGGTMGTHIGPNAIGVGFFAKQS